MSNPSSLVPILGALLISLASCSGPAVAGDESASSDGITAFLSTKVYEENEFAKSYFEGGDTPIFERDIEVGLEVPSSTIGLGAGEIDFRLYGGLEYARTSDVNKFAIALSGRVFTRLCEKLEGYVHAGPRVQALNINGLRFNDTRVMLDLGAGFRLSAWKWAGADLRVGYRLSVFSQEDYYDLDQYDGVYIQLGPSFTF